MTELRELADREIDFVSGGSDPNYKFCWNGPAGTGTYPNYVDCGETGGGWGTDEDQIYRDIKQGKRPQ